MLTFTAPLADSPIADAPFGHVDGARTWPCVIGGHGYVLDHAKSQIKTVPALRQAQDVGTEPGGRSLSIEASWKRTRSSWVGGAGQLYADDATSDPTRFLLSANLDVWDQDGPTLRPKVVRMPRSRLSGADPDSTTSVWVPSVGLVFGCAYGDSDLNASPSYLAFEQSYWRQARATLDNNYLRAVAIDPERYIYVAGVSDIYRAAHSIVDYDGAFDPTTSIDFTLWSTETATRMAICHGFFIGAFFDHLYTWDSSGVMSDFWSHPRSTGGTGALDCCAIVEAPNGIYVGFSSDTQSTGAVYFIGLDSTTGGLKDPVKVADLPSGENLWTMIAYGGFLILGTSEGVRVARVNDDDTITYGSVISVYDYLPPGVPATDRGVLALAAFRDRVYFGLRNVAMPGSGVSSGLGVLNLSHFVDPENLVPAWTIDVLGPPDCLGYVTAIVIAPPRSGATRDDWGIYFFASSSDRWYLVTSSVQESRAQPVGWLEQGWFAFDSTEAKQFLSIDVRTNAPGGVGSSTAGAWLQVDDRQDVSDASYPVLHLGELDRDHDTSDDPWGIGLGAERINPVIELTRDESSVGGHVLRDMTVRAVPAPERVDELVLALIIKRTVETPAGTLEGVDCRGEYEWIKSLEASQAVVRCALGGRTFFARVADVQFDGSGWDDDTDWFEGVCSVRLVTTEAAA